MTAQAGDTFYTRQTLRRELRARRLALPRWQRRRAASDAAAHALRLLRARGVRTVAVYLALGSELDTAPLIRRLHAGAVCVAVPRVRSATRMEFECLPPVARLRRAAFGVAVPAIRSAVLRYCDIDAVVIPLLGFDVGGTRLGSGGGYYDRWLARPRFGRRPLRLGYAYAMQEVATIPRQHWDVPLDAVITERGVRWLTG